MNFTYLSLKTDLNEFDLINRKIIIVDKQIRPIGDNKFDLVLTFNTNITDNSIFDDFNNIRETLNLFLNFGADYLYGLRSKKDIRNFREYVENHKDDYQLTEDEIIYNNGRKVCDCTNDALLHRIGVWSKNDIDFFLNTKKDKVYIELFTNKYTYYSNTKPLNCWFSKVTFRGLSKNLIINTIDFFTKV